MSSAHRNNRRVGLPISEVVKNPRLYLVVVTSLVSYGLRIPRSWAVKKVRASSLRISTMNSSPMGPVGAVRCQ